MSRRNVTPDFGRPLASNALTTTEDCEPPSWLIASGVAVILNDCANSEGPDSSGVSVEWTVHPTNGEREREDGSETNE